MTSKDRLIFNALKQRADVLVEALNSPSIDVNMRHYFVGKLDGYTQAMELLTSSEESIAVELENS